MVVMEEKMVLLLLRRSLENAPSGFEFGATWGWGWKLGPTHPSIPSLPLKGIPDAGSRLRGDYPK